MRRLGIHFPAVAEILFLAGISLLASPRVSAQTADHPSASKAAQVKFHSTRSSPLDLEVGGELAGEPTGSTLYVTREDLLALPQVSYTVGDDSNFKVPVKIGGVLLEELARDIGAGAASDLVVAICIDKYRANYPRAYISAHHPILVLTVDGQPPAGWPKDNEGTGNNMGPYMISHRSPFTPSFKIFAHSDEPQIPWGVVRLEFRDEKAVLGAIAPRGPHAKDVLVQDGYRIAQQNCFRCHSMGREGEQKANRPWQILSAYAAYAPDYFTGYVRSPRAWNPKAIMPPSPDYDDDTMSALIAYFKTFSSSPASSHPAAPSASKGAP